MRIFVCDIVLFHAVCGTMDDVIGKFAVQWQVFSVCSVFSFGEVLHFTSCMCWFLREVRVHRFVARVRDWRVFFEVVGCLHRLRAR